MKRTSKYGLVFAMIVSFVFGTTLPISAKPIDNGHSSMGINSMGSQMWQSDAGIFWDLIITDEFSQDTDYLYVYGWDESTMTLVSSQNFYIPIESNINFKRGVATFTSSVINITAKFEPTLETLETYGSRRDGNLTNHYMGYGSISGTVIINDVTYVLDGTFSDDHRIVLETSHYITK